MRRAVTIWKTSVEDWGPSLFKWCPWGWWGALFEELPTFWLLTQCHLSTWSEQSVPFATAFLGQLGALPIAQTTQTGTEMLRCFSFAESRWQKTHPASSRLSIPVFTLKWCTETSVQMNLLLISYQILANREPSLVLAMLPNVMATLADLETISLHFSKMEKTSSIVTFSELFIVYSIPCHCGIIELHRGFLWEMTY